MTDESVQDVIRYWERKRLLYDDQVDALVDFAAAHLPTPVEDIPPFKKDTLKQVLGLVRMEINRQDDLARAGKFGGTHILPGGPDGDRLKVLIEEVGEVAKELNEDIIEDGGRGRDGLFDELVQTAACAAAWACAVREGRPA